MPPLPLEPDASVLLIDDDESDLIILERMIKASPLEIDISCCKTGEAALAYLNACRSSSDHRLPDLILLDLNMPVMDGIEVLKALRSKEAYKLIPVCVLSATTDSAKTIAAYANGANAVVSKTSSRARMEAVVTEIIKFWFETASRFYMD